LLPLGQQLPHLQLLPAYAAGREGEWSELSRRAKVILSPDFILPFLSPGFSGGRIARKPVGLYPGANSRFKLAADCGYGNVTLPPMTAVFSSVPFPGRSSAW
jgi:hypothetical protein